ncbi:MAG TPA: amidase, partial [Beutenbergiaceae bacterium]|nr:amidase [Beutenbergiaceae bacterium]
GEVRGPLHGVPLAVKDLFWVKETAPNAGGIVFRDLKAPHDAEVVTRLEKAGAIILGKLRMSEAALAAHHPDLPIPLNPWDGDAWIGASSSGNAAATAAGLCYGSLATDTGGSIRFPTAATGLTGLKPTWGAVSARGSVEFAASLDHIGPMARSANDCRTLWQVIRNADLPVAKRSITRLGIDPRFMAECDQDTQAVLENVIATLSQQGIEFTEVSLPPVEPMVDDWTPTCAVEAGVFHEETFRARPQEYGPQVRTFLEQGLAMPAVEYERMRRRRTQFEHDTRHALADVDGVLLQVTGIAGPDAQYLDRIGVGEEWRRKIMMATCPINFLGYPALTMPGGFTETGRPIGFQIVAKPHYEDQLLDVGEQFQERTQFHTHYPNIGSQLGGVQ